MLSPKNFTVIKRSEKFFEILLSKNGKVARLGVNQGYYPVRWPITKFCLFCDFRKVGGAGN